MCMTRLSAPLAFGLAGCSLLYNPSNLPNPPDKAGAGGDGDGGVTDAEAIDGPAPPVDADDSMLALSDITPSTLDEGQGDLGSLPQVFVIRGHNIVNTNLQVVLTRSDAGDLAELKLEPVTDAMAASSHDYLAFTLTSHVVAAIATDVPLDVRVTQDVSAQFGGGTATQVLPAAITLHGLPELLATSPGVNKTTKVISLPLPQAKYSQVDLVTGMPANTTWTFAAPGASPAAIAAVSSIAVGNLVADAAGTTPGPDGHAPGSNAGPGGGMAGQAAVGVGTGGGGGGAGFAVAGTDGAPHTGGAGHGGPPAGEDQILSLESNRASAGAAGGSGLAVIGGVLTPGGAGGAGGGVVELVAGGDLAAGTISANASDGASGGLLGGAGGGGAGGTVIARTTHGALALGAIRVKAGIGSSTTVGAGSVGRVRWDAPAGTSPSSPDRAAHRGPAFQAPPRVVATASQVYTLSGSAGDEIDVRVTDQSNTPHVGEHAIFNSQGIATITAALSPGYNAVCVKLAGGSSTEPLANACVDVVALP